MKSYYLFHFSIKDSEKFLSYAQQAPATLTPYGGEIVLRGKLDSTIQGPELGEVNGILGFPSDEMAEKWYESDQYQALIPLRDEGATTTVSRYHLV